MKSGILALVSISSALVSCTSYERPPLFDQITGKIQGMSGRDDYLSGVGATSGVNTDLPPEARLGQGYWDLPAGTQGKSTSSLTSSSRKSSTTWEPRSWAFPPCLPARKVTALPGEHTKSSRKTPTTNPAHTAFCAANPPEPSSTGITTPGLAERRQEPTSTPPPCPTGCGLREATACMWVCHRISGQPRLRAPAGGHGQDIL